MVRRGGDRTSGRTRGLLTILTLELEGLFAAGAEVMEGLDEAGAEVGGCEEGS